MFSFFANGDYLIEKKLDDAKRKDSLEGTGKEVLHH